MGYRLSAGAVPGSEAVEHLLAGHREVERILRERRQTGAFTLVHPSPTGPSS